MLRHMKGMLILIYIDALHELVSLKRNKLSKYVQAHPFKAGVAGAHSLVWCTSLSGFHYHSR